MSDTGTRETIYGATGSFVFSIVILILIIVISTIYGNAKQGQVAREAEKQNKIQEDFNAGIIYGKFHVVSGDCNRVSIVRIENNILFLDKLDDANKIWEIESYHRSLLSKYKFVASGNPNVIIMLKSATEFSFVSPGFRSCVYDKVPEPASN